MQTVCKRYLLEIWYFIVWWHIICIIMHFDKAKQGNEIHQVVVPGKYNDV